MKVFKYITIIISFILYGCNNGADDDHIEVKLQAIQFSTRIQTLTTKSIIT